jgi:hypothetical protein
MDHLIERIAHHADIDTRRAMGFKPRRLVLPELDLKMNQDGSIIFNTSQIYIGPGQIEWIFGLDDFRTCRIYQFSRNDGRVTFYSRRRHRFIHTWHPNLNRDGSFKRARLEL